MADDGNIDVRVDLDLGGAEEALAELEKRAQSFGAALGGALKSAVIDGRSLDDVLRQLATRMSAIALNAGLAPLERLIGQTVTGLIGSLGAVAPFAKGGVPGRLTAFAEGGVVGAPTLFSMPGGDTGLMGEAGAEAILPLRRGPDGRLGVAAGGGQAPMQITFQVTTPDAASFRKSEAQITALLARAVGRGSRGL
ncbi:hypothetical protein DFR52_102886 [Hoeflea marina]|uniref:Lambda family phage tail tape measure protein n=1 Tax=Hoeflea marina TaxID=274592 RepID=A0A317PQI9_9HYPH|nr:phage tail tape measure protein [Hoeflea marina]PWW02218.1 hypothetical protein DFR52_102886 [Hoeflea marina]